MDLIKVLNRKLSACPSLWNVCLPNGNDGILRYRFGVISLKEITNKPGVLIQNIISEQIGDKYDGVIELDEAIIWLEKNRYTVKTTENSNRRELKMDTVKKIKQALKKQRLKKKMSQYTAASFCNVNRPKYARIEDINKEVHLSAFIDVCEKMGIKFDLKLD
jgi:DNA-binding XRE family transcriptional regulator